MKTRIRFTVLVFLCAVLSNAVWAKDEYTRIIRKEFIVNADAQLVINNSFGKVHCNSWDKNVILIEVQISVMAPDEKSATKVLESINVSITGTASQVEAKSTIPPNGFNRARSSLRIDYTVSMPASVNLDLTNKFGDVFVNELAGKGKISLGYGKLEANKLSNSDNLIDIKFGNANIESLKGAVVNLKYSDFKLGYAGSLRLDSKYSNINADKIISFVFNSEGGKLEMVNSSVLDGTTKFTNINITRLEKKLALEIHYGACDIQEVPADFSDISIRNKYGNVNIGIAEQASYSLDAEMKFCDLDFPEGKAVINQRNISNTSKSYKATVGKESEASSKIFVRSEFGSVSLE